MFSIKILLVLMTYNQPVQCYSYCLSCLRCGSDQRKTSLTSQAMSSLAKHLGEVSSTPRPLAPLPPSPLPLSALPFTPLAPSSLLRSLISPLALPPLTQTPDSIMKLWFLCGLIANMCLHILSPSDCKMSVVFQLLTHTVSVLDRAETNNYFH